MTSLGKEQYRLWLSEPLALYGVENAKADNRVSPSGGANKKMMGMTENDGQDT